MRYSEAMQRTENTDERTTVTAARTIKQGMDDLRAGRITADDLRAIMRASREQHGDAAHDRAKFAAIAASNGGTR